MYSSAKIHSQNRRRHKELSFPKVLLRVFDHPALAGAVDIIVFHRRSAGHLLSDRLKPLSPVGIGPFC